MRKSILIADDNAFVRTVLYEFFERQPDFHVCALAEDGREAIEKACRLKPDLIVLDLSMPVMNGLEAARILIKIMPAVPLIMYSAIGDTASKQIAKSIGSCEVISKSDRVSVLIDKARDLVDKAHGLDERKAA